VKGVAQLLIRLYPAGWRARYGEEFEALLEDSSAGWPAVLDLLKGAIKMQFSVPSFPKLALMLSITGLLIGLVVSSLLKPIYVSEAVVYLEGNVPGSVRPVVEYLNAVGAGSLKSNLTLGHHSRPSSESLSGGAGQRAAGGCYRRDAEEGPSNPH
jgi:hypothetical protein